MNVLKTYNTIRDSEAEQELIAKQKLRRQIEDYLRKYASNEQLNYVGKYLGVIK